MDKKKRPLGRSATIVCAVFVVLLCAILSVVSYRIYTATMYNRYREEMQSIVNYLESCIDPDDMSLCAQTFEESEKYKENRILFDHFIDTYTDIHYLYIIRPMDEGDPFKVRSILSANSTYEKEHDPENVLYIGDGGEDWYTEEDAAFLRGILAGDEDVYYIGEVTEWGTDYTLARPLIDSAGNHYALLCVDISIENIRKEIYQSNFIHIFLILLIGGVFLFFLNLWFQINVTGPLKKLEDSVVSFAASARGKRDPSELTFTPPEIHTRNEVESLSDAVTMLSEEMKEYVTDILKAEDTAKGLRAHMSEMNTIAYQDALTQVKNKAAFERKSDLLEQEIREGRAEFAFVMADLNSLKVINDKYGHDKGDLYIKGTCGVISQIYKHSPVFRVGGDEFLIVLEKNDYQNRDRLLAMLKHRFQEIASGTALNPWERYSAAAGMAVYMPGDDTEVSSVFQRADREMYVAKAKMKENGAVPI